MNETPKSARWPLVLEVLLLVLFAGFAAYSQWSKRAAQAALRDTQSALDGMRNEAQRWREEAMTQQTAAELAHAGTPKSVPAVPAGVQLTRKGCLISDGSRVWLYVTYSSVGVVGALIFGIDSPAPVTLEDHLDVIFEGHPPIQIAYEGSPLRAVIPGGFVHLTTKSNVDIKGTVERVAGGFFTLEATLLDLSGAPSLDAVLGN